MTFEMGRVYARPVSCLEFKIPSSKNHLQSKLLLHTVEPLKVLILLFHQQSNNQSFLIQNQKPSHQVPPIWL